MTANPARAQGEASQTVGIRIVDAPSSRVDDPRAKLYIVDHVAPGTTITRRVEVSNRTDVPQAIQLYAAAAEVTGGSFRFSDGRKANDLTGWTVVNPANLSLRPGTTGLATVAIVVPARAAAGEHYGVVWAELRARAPTGGGIDAVNRVGVRIYLSVGPGGEPPTDFAVATLQARRAADGRPVVEATVRNIGGRALDLSGELRLTNGPGGLSAGPFNATLGTTLAPGQTEPVQVTLDKALPDGPWDARIALRSGATTREATATIIFPDDPGSGSRPVAAAESRDATRLPVATTAFAIAAVVVVLLLLWLLPLRRRPSGVHSGLRRRRGRPWRPRPNGGPPQGG